MGTVLQDVRYGLRMLRKTPGFTAVAVVTLALGIGANTAIFSVLNAVLLRPLPYADPDRLMHVSHVDSEWTWVGQDRFGISYPDFTDVQQRNRTFERLAAFTSGSFVVTAAAEPLRLTSASVSLDLFSVLGVAPIIGRVFLPGEDEPGRAHVAIISYGLWQQLYGGRADVLGKAITDSGTPYTIVGVMPAKFQFLADQREPIEIWVPLARDAEFRTARGAHFLEVIGRLKAGVTPAQAESDLQLITRALRRQYGTQIPRGTSVMPMKAALVENVETALLILAGAVAFVLLIAGTNLAGLLLVRANFRRREIALRLALGASRARLVRQLLTESTLLALAGGAGGLLLAAWASSALIVFGPADLPRFREIAIDHGVLLFTVGASLLSGVAFGLLPALQASSPELNQALKEGTARTGSTARVGMRRVLLGAEVMLAFVLLCGAGLMVRTLVSLTRVDPGFDPSNVLTAEISLPQVQYGDATRQSSFFDQLVARLQQVPGVQSVGGSTSLPMGGTMMTWGAKLPGQPKAVSVGFHAATADYFHVMRIPLIAGRFFDSTDRPGRPGVALVNATMARLFWPGENPVGKIMKEYGYGRAPLQIVGVIGDMKADGLDQNAGPEIYVPVAQKSYPFMRLVLRAKGNPLLLAPMLREQVRTLDKNLPVDKIRTMKSIMAATFARRRFYMLLLGVFAALALGLAAVGIYGIVSYEVSQRTHEIGVRMALGARREAILRMVLIQGLGPSLIGLGMGVAVALGVTRVLRSLLFAVKPTDPVTFLAVAFVLAALAILAALGPARRATKVDPMVALRYE